MKTHNGVKTFWSQLKYGIRLTFGDNSKRDETGKPVCLIASHMSMSIQCKNSELIKQAMMVVTIIASALIYNDYGLCLKQMKLVKRKNSVIENGKAI